MVIELIKFREPKAYQYGVMFYIDKNMLLETTSTIKKYAMVDSYNIRKSIAIEGPHEILEVVREIQGYIETLIPGKFKIFDTLYVKINHLVKVPLGVNLHLSFDLFGVLKKGEDLYLQMSVNHAIDNERLIWLAANA